MENTEKIAPALEKCRIQDRSSYIKATYHWNNLGNQRDFEISKQAITIASIVITLNSLIFIEIVDNSKALAMLYKQFLLIATVLLIGSLFFGLINFYIESKYFNKWSKITGDQARTYGTPILPTEDDEHALLLYSGMLSKVKNLEKNMKFQSNRSSLLLQLCSLTLGVIMVAISFAILILNK